MALILVGCEESQIVTIALRKNGHEAFSCDLKECSGGHPEWHIQGDVFDAIKSRDWDAGIFFPDCTYLTLTGNKWFKDQPERKSGALVGKKRREAREKALIFVCDLMNCGINKIAIENPVGVIGTRIYNDNSLFGDNKYKVSSMKIDGRKPDQIIQPFMFGHSEPKKTCLWLTNLNKLKATKLVEPEYHETKSGKRMPKWYAYADKSKGQSYRAELRSKTFQGIADAMADQWFPPESSFKKTLF